MHYGQHTPFTHLLNTFHQIKPPCRLDLAACGFCPLKHMRTQVVTKTETGARLEMLWHWTLQLQEAAAQKLPSSALSKPSHAWLPDHRWAAHGQEKV